MIAKVIDASAFAAVAFNEAARDKVLERVEGCLLHAPDLLLYEMINIGWKKVQRHPELARLIKDAVAKLGNFTINYHPVDPMHVVDLALKTGLTGYNASYLWLAQSLSAELVTLDERLNAAHTRSN